MYTIDGILFAHRVSKHSSTKYTPFFLMYNSHPVLPIDLEYDLDPAPQNSDSDIPFDREGFNAVLSSTLDLRQDIHEKACQNITKAQQKQ